MKVGEIMSSSKILMALALAGAAAVSAQAAMIANDAMNDYNMETSTTSLDDDLFGFGVNATIWYQVQFTFSNVTFRNPSVGSFNLTGFNIYAGGTNSGGGVLVASTDACTGIATPLPAVQTSIVCATPAGVNLSGTPYFVFPKAGSAGLIGRTISGNESTIELAGIPGGSASAAVPEPSTAALAGLGVVLAGWLRRRNG